MKDDANACLSLAYKYYDLLSCVKAQRPQLLQDPVLASIASQVDMLELAFEQRMYKLASAELMEESYDG